MAPVVNNLGDSPVEVPAIIPFNFPAAETELMGKIALVAHLDPTSVELTRLDGGLLCFQVGHDGPPSPSRMRMTPEPNIDVLVKPVSIARFERNYGVGPSWLLTGEAQPKDESALMKMTGTLMALLYNRQQRTSH